MIIGVDIRSLLERYQGGVSQYTNSLLRALLMRNRTHHYVLFSNSWRVSNSRFSYWEQLGAKIVWLRIPNKIFNLALISGLGPEIDSLLGGVDVFWAPNLQFLSLSRHCKSVITCHDLSFERYPEFLSLRRRLWHKVVRPKRLYNTFNKIVAVSEATADDLMDLYSIPSSKIEVIHSGINADKVTEQDMIRCKDRYKLPRSFVLTLGTLEPRKNLLGILQAYDFVVRTRNISEDLVVIGAKGWKYKDVEETWQRLSSRKRIHFYGYVNDRDRASFYALSRVFVWPSFYEGFGFPPLEALVQNIPVIVGHHSSFPETVGTASLMVDPYNVLSISEALEALLFDVELREELKKRGQAVQKNFSWGQTALAMENLFETF